MREPRLRENRSLLHPTDGGNNMPQAVAALAGHAGCTRCLEVANRCQRACTGQLPHVVTPLLSQAMLCRTALLKGPRNIHLKVTRQAQGLVQLLLIPSIAAGRAAQADSTSCVFRACSTSSTGASQARDSGSAVGPDGARTASRAPKPLQETMQ